MSDARSEIAARYGEWMTAVQRKDFATLEGIVGAEFVYVDDRVGKRERAPWFAFLRGYDIERFLFRSIEVKAYGDVAVALVEYEQTALRDGEPRSGSFLITDVWRRTNDGWQVVTRSSILVKAAG